MMGTQPVVGRHLDKGTDVLRVDHLDVAYRTRGIERAMLHDISFSIGPHESFGIVGESGCGKSTAALAIMRYLPRNGHITGGGITVCGRDVWRLGREELRQLRARSISVVCQEPGRALNPSMRVGPQVAEVFRILGANKHDVLARAEQALRTVKIADPARIMSAYPHQLSGGMLQRVVIAMAIAVEPTLLILDEPTTALDATVEAEVLDLISGLRSRFGTAVMMISHNLAVIAQMCDRVAVMYAGEIVEQGAARDIFDEPRHPYTVGLLRCVPRSNHRKDLHRLETIPGFLPAPGATRTGCLYADRCGLADDRCRSQTPPMVEVGPGRISRCFKPDEAPRLPRATPSGPTKAPERPSGEPLLRARRVSKTYTGRHGESVQALVDADLVLRPGETLGVVGESGCGKTTLARVLVGLTAGDPGAILEIASRQVRSLAAQRTPEELRLLQIVFQNPDSALNRRHSVRHIIVRALKKLGRLDGEARERRLTEIIQSVRMEPRHLSLRPAQLSGGLKQRVAIARAFAGSPSVLVCDEPTSALDVSVQAAILNLLVDLQNREGVGIIFISHDLGVVRYLADRIAVLYLGQIVECGPAESVFSRPHHPYTEALLSAVRTVGGTGPERIRLTGEIPSPATPPSGCVFHTRCHRRLSDGTCEAVEPPVHETGAERLVRCHIPPEQY
jgi:peptide/nickel transport system ATP-binding protein